MLRKPLLIILINSRIPQSQQNLLVQVENDILDQGRYRVVQMIDLVSFIPIKARINNAEKIFQNRNNLFLIRLIIDVCFVNCTPLLIIVHDVIQNTANVLFYNILHYILLSYQYIVTFACYNL